ncbi:MAG: hypothetical protein ACLPR9_16295 [Acidimicrobiales bacterium]|jgi:hypothetical protein
MSEEFEDRLRAHLAGKAASVQVDPDAGAFVERSVGPSGRRGPLAMGAVALAIIIAGVGVLTGVALAGGRATTTTPLAAAPSTGIPGRAGASLAPSAAGGPNLPSIAVPTAYSFLFTRTTSSGVTIRAYGSGVSTTGDCTQGAPCPPVGIVPGPTPCPKGATCAQPMLTPQTVSGATGGGSAVGGTSTTGDGGSTGSGSTESNGSGSTGTAPVPPTASCGQLVVELSTDRTVGSGSVLRPTAAAPSPDTVEVLGVGSFGIEEGAPVSWVAVWVGSGVASVRLSAGGTAVDAMAPSSGIVVLAAPGDAELTGATVVGVDQSGATVATVPADQVAVPDAPTGCTTVPTNPTPTTSPPTTTPPTTSPPTTSPPTTTTTSTGPATTLPPVESVPPVTSTPANSPSGG